jgi:RNA polymerase sigma-70 factor (ECF subfamily)
MRADSALLSQLKIIVSRLISEDRAWYKTTFASNMTFDGSSSSSSKNRTTYEDLLECSDLEVMRELVAGNNDAFAVIFHRYRRLVHVTALRILRDASEAEDLTQSVFLEVYRKVGQFDGERGTLKVWLLQYAYSRSMSRYNFLQVRRRLANSAELIAGEATSLWSPASTPSQEAALLTEEILSRLPEAQRTTIQLIFFEGRTLHEVAEQRQESFSNVRHHYYRGLQKLRTILEKQPESADEKQRAIPFNEVRRAES